MRELTVRTCSLKTDTGIQCLDPLPLSIPSLFPTSLSKDHRSYRMSSRSYQYRALFTRPTTLLAKRSMNLPNLLDLVKSFFVFSDFYCLALKTRKAN